MCALARSVAVGVIQFGDRERERDKREREPRDRLGAEALCWACLRSAVPSSGSFVRSARAPPRRRLPRCRLAPAPTPPGLDTTFLIGIPSRSVRSARQSFEILAACPPPRSYLSRPAPPALDARVRTRLNSFVKVACCGDQRRSREQMLSTSTPLRLSTGACSLSSTTKLPWANEDAQFVAGNYCGVFDGVSALPASRAYARQLSGLTRSTLSREGALVDAAAWKRTAVNALQAAARSAKSLDGASTACLACIDLERCQLSTYVLGDSGWLLFAPSASGRRLCARSSPQLHRVGAPACPYGSTGFDRQASVCRGSTSSREFCHTSQSHYGKVSWPRLLSRV